MQRRNRPEAMDGHDLDPALLADDLRNLEVLNRFFGGRGIIRGRVAPLLDTLPAGSALSVLDIGSGAGDLCRVLVEECRRRRLKLRLYSLDAHGQIQEYARERLADCPEVRFLRGDGGRVPLQFGSVDLALCTLALHHFAEADARRVLGEMRRVTRRWAVVSDLSRGYAAYGGVWLATRLTPNPMTRFDGPVSVQRAFTHGELRALAAEAGWEEARLYSEAWFRMSLVCERPRP